MTNESAQEGDRVTDYFNSASSSENRDEAFHLLEKEFRMELERALKEARISEDRLHACRVYFESVAAAVDELKLEVVVPFFYESSALESTKKLQSALSAYWTRVRIRRMNFGSVDLSDHRETINRLISKIRAVVQQIDITSEKRDQLISLLNKFQAEVDLSRTRLERVGNFFRDMTRVVAEFDDKLGDRVYKWLMLIVGEIDEAKRTQAALPKPEHQRRLEAPARRTESDTSEAP